jgi:hypothetical protein
VRSPKGLPPNRNPQGPLLFAKVAIRGNGVYFLHMAGKRAFRHLASAYVPGGTANYSRPTFNHQWRHFGALALSSLSNLAIEQGFTPIIKRSSAHNGGTGWMLLFCMC